MRFNVYRGTFEADEKPFNQLLGYVFVDAIGLSDEEQAHRALNLAKVEYWKECKCPVVCPSTDSVQ